MSDLVYVVRGTTTYLWCPGCDELHTVLSDGWRIDTTDPAKPTISPSILVRGHQWSDDFPEYRKPAHHVAPGEQTTCHSFVCEGRWEFLSDCTHHLAGQTVAMVPLPDWLVCREHQMERDA